MTPAVMSTVGAVLKGIVTGKSVKTLERPPAVGELAILKVSAVTWGDFRPQESKAMPPDYDPGDCPRAMDGDILISRANTRELVGAPVMVRGHHPQLLLSDKLLKLIPDESAVERRYLVRALRAPAAAQHFAQCAGGTSGSMTNITQDNIRTTPIHLPALPEQRRIAAILDQADALRAKRREALAQLDSLTQSIFIEMFGRATTDHVAWPTISLSEVADVLTGFAFKSDDYVESGKSTVRLCRGANVMPGRVDWQDLACWPKAGFDKLSAFGLDAGDIVMAMDRPWIAEGFKIARITPSDCPALLVQRVARVRAKETALDDFLYRLLSQVEFAKHCRPTETTIPHISPKEIRSFEFRFPPRALQQTFATRIQAVESLKATHRAALAELDALFASLQHRAFAGEL